MDIDDLMTMTTKELRDKLREFIPRNVSSLRKHKVAHLVQCVSKAIASNPDIAPVKKGNIPPKKITEVVEKDGVEVPVEAPKRITKNTKYNEKKKQENKVPETVDTKNDVIVPPASTSKKSKNPKKSEVAPQPQPPQEPPSAEAPSFKDFSRAPPPEDSEPTPKNVRKR